MKEQLISFETAKSAKERGFGLGENDYIMLPTAYELNGNLYNNGELTGFVSRKYNDSPNHLGSDTISDFEASVFIIDNSLDEFILAPTQSLLQKWLREKHNIHIKIDDFIDDKTGIEWDYEIVIIGTDLDEKGNYIPLISYDMNNSIERKFKTYEEALEKGLQEALKLI